MTSSDMLDTGLALQLKRSGELLERDLVALGEVLKRRAFEFKDTVQVGRTHGIHAEPITFGMKLGMWAFEVSRHLKRMRMVTVNASVGKISGAVGAYNNIDPRVEDLVCEELGLGREPISNQVVQRDRHAAFLSCIAIIGASLEKFATEVRHLQRTEVREAEEAFGKGQKGSSAMPHKRNPILSERMAGCARVLRGNALVGHGERGPVARARHQPQLGRAHRHPGQLHPARLHAAEEHEPASTRSSWTTSACSPTWARATASCSAGRSCWPSSTRACCARTPTAWCRTRRCSAWREGVDFGLLIKQNAEAMAVMSPAEVDAAMDPGQYTAGRDVIFGRLEALEF